jgi:hypothetical protein
MAERIADGNLHVYDDLFIDGINYGKFVMPPLIFLLDGMLFYPLKLLHIINFNFGLDMSSLWHTLLLKSRFILLFILSYPLVKNVALVYTNNNEALSRRVANLWITSPLLLFLPFAQGNNDIYPVLLTLIFLYFAFKEKNVWAMVFLGLAAATKNYALFLIPPMAIILADKNIKKTIKYGFISGLVYVIPIIFYLKDLKLFFTGGGEGLFILETIIPAKNNYVIFPILYIFLILLLIFENNKLDKERNTNIVFYGFAFMSLFFATSFFIPQWFLWILPFLIFIIFKNYRLFYIYLILVTVFLFSLFTNWPGNLDLRIFSPLLPYHINEITFPISVKTASLVVSAFAGVYASFFYFLIKDRKKEKNVEKNIKFYVLLNLSPLLVYLIFILFWGVISTNITNHNSLLNKNVINNNYSIIATFNRDQIINENKLNKLETTNNHFLSTSQIVLPLPVPLNEVSNKRDLVLVKFGEGKCVPKIYWGNDESFWEKNSTTKYFTTDKHTYWLELKKDFFGYKIKNNSTIKNIKLAPKCEDSKFELEYIKIIRL